MSEHRVTVDGNDYKVILNSSSPHPIEVKLILRDRNGYERLRRVWYWENDPSPGPKMRKCIEAAQGVRLAAQAV